MRNTKGIKVIEGFTSIQDKLKTLAVLHEQGYVGGDYNEITEIDLRGQYIYNDSVYLNEFISYGKRLYINDKGLLFFELTTDNKTNIHCDVFTSNFAGYNKDFSFILGRYDLHPFDICIFTDEHRDAGFLTWCKYINKEKVEYPCLPNDKNILHLLDKVKVGFYLGQIGGVTYCGDYIKTDTNRHVEEIKNLRKSGFIMKINGRRIDNDVYNIKPEFISHK